MTTAQIKREALEIINRTGSTIKLSDFNVKQARQVIKEDKFLNSKNS